MPADCAMRRQDFFAADFFAGLFLVPVFFAVFLAVAFLAVFFAVAFFVVFFAVLFFEAFLAVAFLVVFFAALFLEAAFLAGTFAPASRASDKPIAIACFLLVTFFPEPLLSVPALRSCMVFSTLSCAFLEYFAMIIVFDNPLLII